MQQLLLHSLDGRQRPDLVDDLGAFMLQPLDGPEHRALGKLPDELLGRGEGLEHVMDLRAWAHSNKSGQRISAACHRNGIRAWEGERGEKPSE